MTVRRQPLVIDTDHHATGERVGVERHGLRQALAWQVAAEVARRHPGDILAVETHPGGGQYDCVTLFVRAEGDDAEHRGGWRRCLDLNKATPLDHLTHAGWSGDGERFNWLDVLLSPDLRAQVIAPLERAEGLEAPASTPSTVASTVSVRLLAAFASRVAFTRKPWVLLNGYLDSDGGSEARDDLFAAVPAIGEHRQAHREDDLLGTPEYRYWFAVEGEPNNHGRPHMAVDTRQGIAYTQTGTVDLLDRYRDLGRRIDGLASEVCPPAY